MAKKDPAAQAMAKKRWSKVSPEARSQAGRKMAQARWGTREPARSRGSAKKPRTREEA